MNLGDKQELIFRAGASGTMVGNYLTSTGRPPDEVLAIIRAQGLEVQGPEAGGSWAFTGEAPHAARWNERAAEGDPRPSSLPVVN